MRILYLHQYFCPPEGASGTRSYEFGRRLVATGNTVDIITSSANLPKKWQNLRILYDISFEGLDIHVCSVNYSNKMGPYQRLKAFGLFVYYSCKISHSLLKPDVVYASSTPLTIGLTGIYAAKYHKCPMVFEVRDCWPEVPIALGWLKNPLLQMLAYWLQKMIYSFSKHIIALSPDMKKYIVKRGVPDKKISVIPNCGDNQDFKPARCDFELRRQLGWPEDAIIAIHSGAMGQVNGLGEVLKMAKIIKSLAPRVLCVLIGDGKERPALEARKATEGISNIVIQDSVTKKEMPSVLASADIGLMTVLPINELYANSANKFFDYLATGLPVVMNYEGWKAELIRKFGAGLVAPPGDTNAFAETVAQLANDEDLRKRTSLAARHLSVTHFDREYWASQLEGTLRKITFDELSH